jgi:hypothetical protein
MKDKVKEFELYDIQVLRYKDLLIYDYKEELFKYHYKYTNYSFSQSDFKL